MKHFAAAFLVLSVLAAPSLAVAQAEEKPSKDKAESASQQAELMKVMTELLDEAKQLRREVNQLKAEVSAGRREGERERHGRVEDEERRERRVEGTREREREGEGLERRGGREGEKAAKKRRKGEPEAIVLKSSGIVRAVSQEGKARSLTFTVKEEGKEMEMTCVMGEATTNTLNDKEVELEDLKPGDFVVCEYVLKGEKMTAVAQAIAAKRGTVLEGGK